MYKVPKFIRREAKIVWFFTFKQFIYVGMAGAISFLLYFTLAEKNLLLFLFLAAVLMAASFALAFLKIGGTPLLSYLESLVSFLILSKKYLWKKKRVMPKISKRKKPEEKVERLPPLRIIERSRLRELSIEVETKR